MSFFVYLIPDRTGISKCCFLRSGENRVPGEKPLKARETTNDKLNPHMASAGSSAPPLLSKLSIRNLSHTQLYIILMMYFQTYFLTLWILSEDNSKVSIISAMVREEKKLKPRTFNLYFSLMKIALISALYKFFFYLNLNPSVMIMYRERILMTTGNKTESPKKVFQQKNIIN